jgi:hypothetical protein
MAVMKDTSGFTEHSKECLAGSQVHNRVHEGARLLISTAGGIWTKRTEDGLINNASCGLNSKVQKGRSMIE